MIRLLFGELLQTLSPRSRAGQSVKRVLNRENEIAISVIVS
jgi:hypothetical protein